MRGAVVEMQVMNQAGRLCELALQRAALLMAERGPPYRQMLETMQSRQETLRDAAAHFDDQICALQQQKSEGEAFRGTKRTFSIENPVRGQTQLWLQKVTRIAA